MVASKSILTVTTLAFALMFGGGIYVLTHIDQLAKPMTERIASEVLGVKVSIGAMAISLPEKRVDISNIRIANPKGYSKPYAVTIKGAQVALNDVSKSLIDFKGIRVVGTKVFLEVKEGSTNLHALKKGMKVREPAPDKEPMKVIVRRFALKGAQLHPSVTLITEQDLQPVMVAPIVLNGVGVKENGILAHEAVAQILAPLLDKFTKAGGDAGFYQGMSPDALKEMGQGQVEQIKSQVRDEVDKIGEGLKKMFQ